MIINPHVTIDDITTMLEDDSDGEFHDGLERHITVFEVNRSLGVRVMEYSFAHPDTGDVLERYQVTIVEL